MPFVEGSRIKHVLELFIFKTEAKLFWEANVLCQRMVADENSIPLSNKLLRAAPIKDVISTSKVDHPFFSLVYTCRYFTGVIACLINQGKM